MPEPVRERYRGKELPIKLDAAHHRFNESIFWETDLTPTLSFDALRTCRIPWSAIRQVVFFPAAAVESEPVKADKKPFLRLVE